MPYKNFLNSPKNTTPWQGFGQRFQGTKMASKEEISGEFGSYYAWLDVLFLGKSGESKEVRRMISFGFWVGMSEKMDIYSWLAVN